MKVAFHPPKNICNNKINVIIDDCHRVGNGEDQAFRGEHVETL